MRLLAVLLPVALLARPAAAQSPDASRRTGGAAVTGVVHDSIAHAPLAGALVQLVAADSSTHFSGTVTSDSAGRFSIVNVPDGRYVLGFLHPMLDSLGLEPPTREVAVRGQEPVQADLAIPAPTRLRAAVCGATASDAGAVVVGIVRGAQDGAPAAGATVTGEWLEFTLGAGGISRRAPRLTATAAANGWFALCGVPSGGRMTLAASRGADSTDRIEVQVPADGFLRHGLYLGPARTVVAGGDTTGRADSLARPRRLRVGDGRLSGTVVAAVGGRPLAGAQVGIVDGPRTRTDERGEWTLTGAPAGTRMLDVRAVGYYPERRGVDVVAEAPPVRAALSTLKAVLDTVRVAAHYDPSRSGFLERSRSGAGRYLRSEDVARRAPIVTSELFRTIAGVRLEPGADGLGDQLFMRGPFGLCAPAVYLDGRYFREITSTDLDALVRPSEIAGIEVYTDAAAPAQFRALPTNPDRDAPCGSVVIWTR